MLNCAVNVPFNNVLFSTGTMQGMHPSAERLYRIAAEMTPAVLGQSAIARWLDESPQTVKNWESRGVSKQGALKVQERSGYNAKWLLGGEGPELIAATTGGRGEVFERMDERERQLLEDFRHLTDNDRTRFAREIGERAEELRSYLEQEMSKIGLPTRSAGARRSSTVRTSAEPSQRQLPLGSGRKHV